MFSCSSSQSYSLVHCSVLSVSVTASVQFLIPSSSYSLSLFICFPHPPLFHNPDEKKWGSALKIFHGGRRVLAEAKQRDEERRRARSDTQRENMIRCSPASLTEKDPCLTRKSLESYLRQRGHAENLLYVATQGSMQAHTH